MTNPEFFHEFDLTPEQRVIQNEQLRAIDQRVNRHAQDVIATQHESTAEGIKHKVRLLFNLESDAKDAAQMLAETLDPDYEIARIIHISEPTTQPSRLPFLHAQVRLSHTRELAAWQLTVAPHDLAVPYLGRDGILYAMHNEDKYYITKKIELIDLHIGDLGVLLEGVSDLVRRQELYKKLLS